LILRKIIKIWATRCLILRLKCIKFDFGWGSAQTPLGKLTALPQASSWILWGLFVRHGRQGDDKEERGKREGKEIEGKKNLSPLKFKSGYDTVH